MHDDIMVFLWSSRELADRRTGFDSIDFSVHYRTLMRSAAMFYLVDCFEAVTNYEQDILGDAKLR